MKKNNGLWRVILLGSIAGMRCNSAPAIIAGLAMAAKNKDDNAVSRFLSKAPVALGLKVLAGAEFIGDKIPGIPDRIDRLPLTARMLSGAFAGGVLNKMSGRSVIKGALVGGAAALASAYAMFYLRKETCKRTGIADPLLGAVEDALVIGGNYLLKK